METDVDLGALLDPFDQGSVDSTLACPDGKEQSEHLSGTAGRRAGRSAMPNSTSRRESWLPTAPLFVDAAGLIAEVRGIGGETDPT